MYCGVVCGLYWKQAHPHIDSRVVDRLRACICYREVCNKSPPPLIELPSDSVT